MGGQEGGRRQGKRIGQGGGDPSLQQGQDMLLVLHAEVGRQVLTAPGSHCSSHQQLSGSPGPPGAARPRGTPGTALLAHGLSGV